MLKKVGKNFDILKIKRNFDIFLFEAFFILIAFAFWVFWYYKKSIVFNNLSMSAIEGVYFVLMFFSFFIIRKLNSGIFNIGWFLLIFGLLINFLDVLMGEHFFFWGRIIFISRNYIIGFGG